MSLSTSVMVDLGSRAKDFDLIDAVSGRSLSLNEAAGSRGSVLLFLSSECPFVLHIISEFSNIEREFSDRGIAFIGIASNDIEVCPEDRPDELRRFALNHHLQFPICLDQDQVVAHSFGAACTPDIFVVDRELTLVYRGRFDQTKPDFDEAISDGSNRATGEDLREALRRLASGLALPLEQHPSIGCAIKWRSA